MTSREESKKWEHEGRFSKFFVERRTIGWALLLLTAVLGIAGFFSMPKQKDPPIAVRVATAVTTWPGVDAKKVEQLVTRPIEETIGQNARLHEPSGKDYGIKSLTLPGISIVNINLDENVKTPEREFSDINLRLRQLQEQLPDGVGEIQFNSGFGDTAALMLTIASPPERVLTRQLRAEDLRRGLKRARASSAGQRSSLIYVLPEALDHSEYSVALVQEIAQRAEREGLIKKAQLVQGATWIGLDFEAIGKPAQIIEFVEAWTDSEAQMNQIHPEAQGPIMIGKIEAEKVLQALEQHPAYQYSYRELRDYARLISRSLRGVPEVSKVSFQGDLKETIEVLFKPENVNAGFSAVQQIGHAINEENITRSAGRFANDGMEVWVDPSGQLASLEQLRALPVDVSGQGDPLPLGELADVRRTYASPPAQLNYLSTRLADGSWARLPAITVSVFMRDRQQISAFGAHVDEAMSQLAGRLPEDLLLRRTSDQPLQVEENVELFMDALYEAILLVVFVALIGFRDWRSALLMMFSIPLTLAMTMAACSVLGIQIHQVSIAALIIALGLLVDDPVVAGDAIKRDLAEGTARKVAAWLGPTKLAKAILFATITNVVAYLPFGLIDGNTGDFLLALPYVMTCALISSRLVSMSFVPLLGYYLLRSPKHPEQEVEPEKRKGFSGWYTRSARACLNHRWIVLTLSLGLIFSGVWAYRNLIQSFFPVDEQYLASVDVHLPNSVSVDETNRRVAEIEEAIFQASVAEKQAGRMQGDLVSVTSFVGAGGPRFWQTVTPELPQNNYAQIVLELEKKDETTAFVTVAQEAVNKNVAGAYVDVKPLLTSPVPQPVELILSGISDADDLDQKKDIAELRRLGEELRSLVHRAPSAARVRTSWLEPRPQIKLDIDQNAAALAGLTNNQVASASQSSLSGVGVTQYREGTLQIPVVARASPLSRPSKSRLGDVVAWTQGAQDQEDKSQGVLLASVASTKMMWSEQRIERRDHFRTNSVYAQPQTGRFASQIIKEIGPDLKKFKSNLPPGYQLTVGGELAHQKDGFSQLLTVLAISAIGIFLALVFQFESFKKPFLVFSAVPFGIAGSMLALLAVNKPFSFMAFLGVASLVGVIVSHIIVLFDFIDEMEKKGEDIERALIDAGLVRLRPVMITVGATVLALVPLWFHGGPLWQPLCAAQIGGLLVATVISLVIIPAIYMIVVNDLKLMKWGVGSTDADEE